MMTTEEMIIVIRAEQRREMLEIRPLGGHRWIDNTGLTPLFNFNNFEYRVKPKPQLPRDRWLVNNGLLETPFDSLHEATAMAALCEGYVTHYREVV